MLCTAVNASRALPLNAGLYNLLRLAEFLRTSKKTTLVFDGTRRIMRARKNYPQPRGSGHGKTAL